MYDVKRSYSFGEPVEKNLGELPRSFQPLTNCKNCPVHFSHNESDDEENEENHGYWNEMLINIEIYSTVC